MLRRATLTLGLVTQLACAHRGRGPEVCAEPPSARAPAPAPRAVHGKPLEQLQREFVELRFGMFMHFGILTYTG